ncbi:MAG: tyrosine-protein phosphatase [Thermomicrobiales bacterium]
MTIHEARILQLEGAANFRDVGGLPTSDGGFVRRGRIFRSDVLYRLTERDTVALRPLGIRTVIDLRSPDEVHHYPESPLKVAGLRHFNVPIVSEVFSATESVAEDYLILLRSAREGFRTIFGHLANDHYPLVINCFAGKDRTGLTSALILGALGVQNGEIVADYALSERHMVRLMDIHRMAEDRSVDTGPLPNWLAGASATMEATLLAISDEWGSVRGYLDSIGVPAEELQQMRETLVEFVSEHQDEP